MQKILNFINGSISSSSTGKFSPVFDPSTGEQISEVILSTNKELNEVIKSS